jgi:FMN phosphatase YigB (HAD superfamily)
MNKTVIFDIDGTLANVEHRLHFLKENPANWSAWENASPQDLPVVATTLIARMFLEKKNITTRFWSSRPAARRITTLEWLKENISERISDWQLKLRPNRDNLPAAELKRVWLTSLTENPGQDILCVFENDVRVKLMYEQYAIPVFHIQYPEIGYYPEIKL